MQCTTEHAPIKATLKVWHYVKNTRSIDGKTIFITLNLNFSQKHVKNLFDRILENCRTRQRIKNAIFSDRIFAIKFG